MIQLKVGNKKRGYGLMRRNAKETLGFLKEMLESNLAELNYSENNEFVYGEKTAYVECLEIIQQWDKSKKLGLTYNIQKRFPL